MYLKEIPCVTLPYFCDGWKFVFCYGFRQYETPDYLLTISSGAPNVNFRKVSVRNTIWDLQFTEHLL